LTPTAPPTTDIECSRTFRIAWDFDGYAEAYRSGAVSGQEEDLGGACVEFEGWTNHFFLSDLTTELNDDAELAEFVKEKLLCQGSTVSAGVTYPCREILDAVALACPSEDWRSKMTSRAITQCNPNLNGTGRTTSSLWPWVVLLLARLFDF
jgi:hypothetical protein